MSQPRTTGRTVHLNGIDLHYEPHGQGEPLLLLHGMTGCGRDWRYAGLDRFASAFEAIAIDARGHGGSTSPETFTHRQSALDTLALCDWLGLGRVKAIGMSMGANTLLHVATLQPERVEAMVLVSGTMRFPETARAIMRAVPPVPPEPELQRLRDSHLHGEAQVAAVWALQRALADSHDDVDFTTGSLAAVTARTLVVYGDRDPLYPVEMGVEMHRAIAGSALWVVPGGGHGPVFAQAADRFAEVSLDFLRTST